MSSALALLLAVLDPATPGTACGAELEAARQAYGTYDVPAARRGYARVADGRCDASARAEAATELARIAWLIDADGRAAVARLRTVPAVGREGCAAAAMLGRVLTESGRASAVAAALAPARRPCAEIDPSVALAVTGASVALAAATPPAARARAAAAGLSAWAALPSAARATLPGSRQQLALGLLAGDAVAASAGWRSFFAMDGGLAGSRIPADLDAVVAAGLPPRAGEAARAALVDALIRAGFADEARRLMPDAPTAGPAWRSARGYFRLRDRLSAILVAHDRAHAAGERADDAGLEGSILATMRDALTEAGEAAVSDPWPALRRRWNLFGTTGRSNGVEGLHLGHVSTDVALSVTQDGRRGAVRFVALDNMIANGFSGWLGDGVSGPGGWAADGRIVQVRARYVRTAFDRAAIASPGPARDAFIARLNGLEAADRAAAAPSPGRFLPGLSARLQLAAVDALAAEVRGMAGDPTTVAARLAALWYARSLDATILRHEGRHALDQAQFAGNAALGDAELEFRAKLSELEYGASPRLALAAIYGRLLGGETGHGVANLRLVEALASWVAGHRGEVAGYDQVTPALLQLWRLDDRQLRAVAQGLDPARRPLDVRPS